MGEPVKIKDLAFKMIKLSGRTPHMEGGYSKRSGDIGHWFTPGEKMFELSYGGNW